MTVVVLLPGYEYAGRWDAFERHVREVVREANAHKVEIQYDIWNEPDHENFWKGSRDEFFEWWVRSFRLLRRLDPEKPITGPSVTSLQWSPGWTEAFLVYARNHDTLPDILGWHSMSGKGQKIEPDVKSMQGFLARNGIKINRFETNEIIGKKDKTRPGTAVAFFSAIERAGIVCAGKAIWGGEPEAPQRLLNHLLTPDREPRSVWWAYRRYADVTGKLVTVKKGKATDAVAGYDLSTERIRVLVGRFGEERADVEVRLRNLAALWPEPPARECIVRIERIPHTDEQKLSPPLPAEEVPVEPQDNMASVVIPNLGPDDATFLVVERH